MKNQICYAPDDGGGSGAQGAAAPTPSAAAQDAGSAPPPASRPEYVPEKFWNTETNGVRVKEMAASYTELEQALSGKLDPIKESLKKEMTPKIAEEMKSVWEAESKAAHEKAISERRPADPTGYEVDMKSITLPEGMQLEIKADSQIMQFWQKFCFDNGYGGDVFNMGVQQFVDHEVGKMPDREAEMAKLGEKGPQRIERVNLWAQANLSDATYRSLDRLVNNADGVAALEEIMTRMGESPMGLGESAQSPQKTEGDLRKMMQDPRYFDMVRRDPAYVAEVDKAFQQLYPGKTRAAYG